MTEGREQLELALPAVENGGLFAEHFVRARLPDWPELAAGQFEELHRELSELWQREKPTLPQANEAQTEERFVKPILRALGFAFTVQPGVRVAGGRRQPDYALFLSDTARSNADGVQGIARYHEAVAVADAKRFERPLDRRERTGTATSDDAVAQIINYVLITRRRWGVLTNGRLWRLYAADTALEGTYWQVDLVALLERDDTTAFAMYLDNVDVNGVIANSAAISVDVLSSLLNSRLLDFIFRRGSVPFSGAFFSANRQFIAPLPIRLPGGDESATLAALGTRLYQSARAVFTERDGFLTWLEELMGACPTDLDTGSKLERYELLEGGELLALRRRNRGRISRDPDTRAFSETLSKERDASAGRLSELASALSRDERDCDAVVYELYGLTAAQRQLVDAEYAIP